jgi:hypothetical protein
LTLFVANGSATGSMLPSGHLTGAMKVQGRMRSMQAA